MTQIEDASEAEEVEPDYQLPELEGAQYLVDMLMEMGAAKHSGGNMQKLDWVDLKAWAEVTGADIPANEFKALIEMSSAYVSQFYASLESNCLAPHLTALPNRAVVESKIQSLFTMLRGKPK